MSSVKQDDTLKRLSVIIVTYNSERDIYDCLKSVFQYNDLPKDSLEVIVVDNNSKAGDDMFSTIRQQYGEQVVCIKNASNGGYGQGNNVGLRRSTAPVALIMNPDVRLVEPVFQAALQKFKHDSRLSMYGMRQMISADTPSNNSFRCTSMMNGYVSTILTAVCMRLNLYIPRLMYLNGACFFVKRETFKGVGYFDETNFMYGEEDDIHWRIGKTYGYHFAFNRHLHYVHKTEGRMPSVENEMKMLSSEVAQNAKKGYPASKTFLNSLRRYNLLVWRERIKILLGGGSIPLYNVFKASRKLVRQLYKAKPPLSGNDVLNAACLHK